MKLPRTVWRAGKIQALDENRDFQSLVADAIELYVSTRRTKEARDVK